MPSYKTALGVILGVLLSLPAFAQTVSLAWTASVPGDVDGVVDPIAGYIVYAGSQSRVYTTGVDVQNLTSYLVALADPTQIRYFTVLAYGVSGQQSAYGPEVSTTVPSPCTFSVLGPSAAFGNGASSGELQLAVSSSACKWTVAVTGPWLTVAPGSGIGAATLAFSMPANDTTVERIATVTIDGASATIRQAAGVILPPPSDTIAPDVSLETRRAGNSSNYTVIVSSQATDVARVDVYVDEVRKAGTLALISPYTPKVTIQTAGPHVIRVEVRDHAGNVGTASTTVTR